MLAVMDKQEDRRLGSYLSTTTGITRLSEMPFDLNVHGDRTRDRLSESTKKNKKQKR